MSTLIPRYLLINLIPLFVTHNRALTFILADGDIRHCRLYDTHEEIPVRHRWVLC